MNCQHPEWKEYELIDSGNFEKLERFGAYTLVRPEPQALWKPTLPEHVWKSTMDAHFTREQHDNFRFTDEAKGGWKKTNTMPDSWVMQYTYKHVAINLRLALTGFGHVGIFPEQANNWNFIYDALLGKTQPHVLNLFAYTGAASMMAKKAGAQVTHVDASRPGLNWANENMKMNELTDIRWVYEDALKFVKREVKRGNKYHGIIMDPPPYGRGPDGEKWTLVEKLDELVELSSRLLKSQNTFFILSMYAVGLSSTVGKNVVATHFPNAPLEYGEFYLPHPQSNLPMGTFVRFNM